MSKGTLMSLRRGAAKFGILSREPASTHAHLTPHIQPNASILHGRVRHMFDAFLQRLANTAAAHAAAVLCEQHPRILVVGAGFAGLGAARRLKKAGFEDVVVLEASERVGGRASTIEVAGVGLLEAGATWMHGTQTHPAYAYAREHGILPEELDESDKQWGQQHFFREGSEEQLKSEDVEAVKDCMRYYSDEVESAKNQCTSERSPLVTIGDYLRQAWEALIAKGSTSSHQKELQAEAWSWREKLQRAIDGCHTTDDLHAAAAARYTELPGPHTPLPCGYQVVANAFADGLDIRFNHTVEQIRWSEDGIMAWCTNGQQLNATAIIVTIPLGVLKEREETLFQPPLPTEHRKAISALRMGYVEKIFVKFEDRVVVPSEASARDTLAVADDHRTTCETDTSDKPKESQERTSADQAGTAADGSPEVKATETDSSPPVYAYQFLWRTSQQSTSCGYPGVAVPLAKTEKGTDSERHSQHGASVGASNTDDVCNTSPDEGFRAVTDTSSAGERSLPSWVRGIYSLRIGGAELKEREGCDFLGIAAAGAMWIAGLEAKEMAEASDEEVQMALRAVFRAFPAAGLPEQFSFYRTRWAVGPLSRGSYSYPAKGCDGTEFEQLASPVTVVKNEQPFPVLQFAGESTHTTHFGTTHGAWFSGERAADRLIEAFGGVPVERAMP